MLRRHLLVAATVAVPAAPIPASAQADLRPDSAAESARSAPFGLRLGTPKAQLETLGKLKRFGKTKMIFHLSPVPSPHDAFTEYVVIVSDAVGLCKVVAAGKTIEAQPDGAELKSAFYAVEAELTQRYGKHLRVDSLQQGSSLTAPSDWMTAMSVEERKLAAFWDAEEASILPADIRGIHLETVAGTKRGEIRLSYEFSNFDACSAELEKKRS